MRGRQRRHHERVTGRERAERVALQRRHGGLVQGDPVPDAVAEPTEHQLDVVGEAGGGVAREPAARVLERLREVPVVERRHGPDVRLEQRVHEPGVGRGRPRSSPGAVGLHAGPRDREAVVVDAELGECATSSRQRR